MRAPNVAIRDARIVRPDGGPDFVLGLGCLPGTPRETRDLLAWAPTHVATIAPADEALLDGLTDALGDIVLETFEVDEGDLPRDPDLRAERREILCHLLARSAAEGGGRILLLSETAGTDLASLAAELLLIAGHRLEGAMAPARELSGVSALCGARVADLTRCPEAAVGGSLRLPFMGGYAVTRPEGSGDRIEGILRADGYYPVENGATLARPADGQAMPVLRGPDLGEQGKVRIHAGEIPPASRLPYYAEGFQADLTARVRKERPCMHLGMGACLHVSGLLSEEVFRALPQG